MTPTIVMTDAPDSQMRRAIVEPLLRFNEQRAGRPVDYRPFALLLSHPETGEIIGGLWSGTDFTQLHVDLLFVPETLRGSGMGRRLMHQAEEEAGRRGASVHGSTRSASRPVASTSGWAIPCSGSSTTFPPGHSRIFMKKTFLAAAKEGAS